MTRAAKALRVEEGKSRVHTIIVSTTPTNREVSSPTGMKKHPKPTRAPAMLA